MTLLNALGPQPELDAVAAVLDSDVTAHGHPAAAGTHLVGGTPRVLLLGETTGTVLASPDLDICSVLRPEQVRAAINRNLHVLAKLGTVSVFDIGEDHGTTGITVTRPDGTAIEIEHTTFRSDRYEEGSRTPVVCFGTDIVDDLARRDLTVNAVAVRLADGHVLDPFNGRQDLIDGVIRCPGDPNRILSEDPLRIVRAARFAATLGFALDDTVRIAARNLRDRLGIVSRERITAELAKVLKSGPATTSRFVDVCAQLEITGDVFPGLELGTLADSDASFAANVVLAALCAGTDDLAAKLAALKMTKRDAKDIAAIAALAASEPGDDRDRVRTARRAGQHVTAGAAAAAQLLGRTDRAAELCELSADGRVFAALPVTGRDVPDGVTGKAIGAALANVEAAFCENLDLTRDEALAVLCTT